MAPVGGLFKRSEARHARDNLVHMGWPKVKMWKHHQQVSFLGWRKPYRFHYNPLLDGMRLNFRVLDSKGILQIQQMRHCKAETKEYFSCVAKHDWKNACWEQFLNLTRCRRLTANEQWRPPEARRGELFPRFYEFLWQVLGPDNGARSQMRHYFNQQYSHDLAPMEDSFARARHLGRGGPFGSSGLQWSRFMNMSFSPGGRRDVLYSPDHVPAGVKGGSKLPMMW